MRREACCGNAWEGAHLLEQARLESHSLFLRIPCTADIDRRKETVVRVEAHLDLLRLLK